MDKSPKSPNRGVSFFLKCMESSPDVINAIKGLSNPTRTEHKRPIDKKDPQLVIETSNAVLIDPIKSLSGFAYNLKDRFASRPSSAPGPCTYFVMKPHQDMKGLKFSSRNEKELPSTPGSYALSDTLTTRFGYMTRQPKNKNGDEITSPGPGAYQSTTNPFTTVGASFTRGSRDLSVQPRTEVPGPGHYNTETPRSKNAYIISKPGFSVTTRPQKLGPGSYEIASPLESHGHTFSIAPRFDSNFFDKVECEE